MFYKNTYDQLQRSWAAIGVAGVSVAAGVIKGAQAKKAQRAALAKRTAYQTPQELIEVINAQRAMADQGLPEQTLNYLTNQNDRAFNTSLGTLQRLGGEANSAAALFDQSIQNSFKIGSENTLMNMQNFSKFIDAGKYLAQSRDAEWASEQGMIKDEQAAAHQRRLEATAQIGEGINTGISVYANYKLAQLYNKKKDDTSGGSIPMYVPNANNATQSSNQVRSQGAAIGASIIGYDPTTGIPIYG